MFNTPTSLSWPPKRRKLAKENSNPFVSEEPTTPSHISISSHNPLTPVTPTPVVNTVQQSLPTQKPRKTYRNGYEVKPATPSFQPFRLNNPGHPRQKAFAFEGFCALSAMSPLTEARWNALAQSEGLLVNGQQLYEYQIEVANYIIARDGDLCVIAPTGAGKSLIWVLPLLAQKGGISVVIIPYTSLGFQGEDRHKGTSIKCTFLHSGSHNTAILENIARGGDKHVVYTCAEMLETPAVARVVHSKSFQRQLSGVYIDEAHVIHESQIWRPSYTRLHLLRTIIGHDIPLIAISATLPKLYRDSIQTFAGLQPSYRLINLGNFRPELSTIISYMQHPSNSFLDLEFVLPRNSTINSIPQTIIYADNLELLTAMFWWFHSRLGSMGLPVRLVDILHAGLSDDHQKICTADFIDGKSKILLGSDKIGAGMDFPHVSLVIQYQCRGLTLVKWEQRRGRGGRRRGQSAVGVILVEKSMFNPDDDEDGGKKLSPSNPKSEDPGLIALIQTRSCQEDIVDMWLQNPPREKSPLCGRCSNCNPNLNLQFTYTWIMEDPRPRKAGTRTGPNETQMQCILQRLRDWRQTLWSTEWQSKWPSYGPCDLICDADLEQLAYRAPSLRSIDDIDAVTQIPHLDNFAASLLQTINILVNEVIGLKLDEDLPDENILPNTPHRDTPALFTNLTWAPPENIETVREDNNRRLVGTLSHGESVVNFDK